MSSFRLHSGLCSSLFHILLLVFVGTAAHPSGGRLLAQTTESLALLTTAEATDFRETTRHLDVVAFSEEVARISPDIHLTTYGYSFEGRRMPLLVVGKVDNASPEAVLASGKTRVYVQGGIHAGEICGKEALMMLLRELSQGEHAQWADSLVILVAPLFNPDGNERINLRNRRRQHGPVGGMGQRANAMGLDLNRDQMKLDAPESRALVSLYSAYDPHVSVDLHTTNGTRHGYHLTYAPPLSPNTPSLIDDLLRERWLPRVTQNIKEKHGWDMYYYGGAYQPRGATESGWYTFDHRPRFVSNYIGLRNRFGILSEAFSYATFQDRILASKWFVEEIIDFAFENAGGIQDLAEQADRISLVGDSLALRAELARSAEPVTILMGEVEEDPNPYTGDVMFRRTEVQVPTEMYEFGTFVPSEKEEVPAAYYLPPGISAATQRLLAHGIQYRVLEGSESGEFQEFMVDSVTTASREYQGHIAQEVWGTYRTVTREVEAGTVVVPMDQPLARVVFMLVEPRSDDGFVGWGLLGETLVAGEGYPVLRSLSGGG